MRLPYAVDDVLKGWHGKRLLADGRARPDVSVGAGCNKSGSGCVVV